MDDAQMESIRALAEPILAAASTELVELSCHRQGRQVAIRVLVDKVGGVTIRHCARLNQQISQALEAAHYLEQPYTLEVSSPGLDRPLTSKRDFERALGEPIELDVEDAPRGGVRRVTGQLLAVQDAAIVVITASGTTTISMAQIRRALKAIELSS